MDYLVTLEKNETLVVIDRPYYSKVVELLEKTPNRTIANLFAFRTVFFGMTLLNGDLQKLYDQFDSLTNGRVEADSKLKECVKLTEKLYGEGIY